MLLSYVAFRGNTNIYENDCKNPNSYTAIKLITLVHVWGNAHITFSLIVYTTLLDVLKISQIIFLPGLWRIFLLF